VVYQLETRLRGLIMPYRPGLPLDEDPAGPKAQALLDRWKALIEEFTGGNQQIKEGMGRAWQDSDNWTPQMKKVREPFGDPRVWEFIRKAGQAREAAGRG